jgi:hypothetical protein
METLDMAISMIELKSMLQELELSFREYDEKTVLIVFNTENYNNTDGDAKLLVGVQLQEDGEFLNIFTPNAFFVPEKKRNATIRTCMMLQYKTKLIKFWFDEDDGELRAMVHLPIEDAELTSLQLYRSMECIVTVIDDYYTVLNRAITAGVVDFDFEKKEPDEDESKDVLEMTFGSDIFEGEEDLSDNVDTGEAAKKTVKPVTPGNAVKEDLRGTTFLKNEKDDGSVENFRQYLGTLIKDLRLPKGRPYGYVIIDRNFQVEFAVKRDHVSVGLCSLGGVAPEKVVSWINTQKLRGKHLYKDQVIEPYQGKRNASVVRVDFHIPFESKEELTEENLKEEAVALFKQIQNTFSEIGRDLSENVNSITASNEVPSEDEPASIWGSLKRVARDLLKKSDDESETPVSDDPIEDFRQFMAGHITELRLPKGRPYASVKIGKNYELVFHIRKNDIGIFFSSDGKVSGEDVRAWIEAQGLSGEELAPGYVIDPQLGARNPNVIRVEFTIPLEREQLLYNVGLRKEVLGLFQTLFETFSPIADVS